MTRSGPCSTPPREGTFLVLLGGLPGSGKTNSGDRRIQPRLDAIEEWSKQYSAPGHAVVHPVWRPA